MNNDLEIIAEIGSTFWVKGDLGASLSRAKDSIQVAAECGATAVKFQYFTADSLYSKERASELHERTKQYELPKKWISSLKATAHGCGVKFGLSVFNPILLNEVEFHLDFIKIASGDLTYTSLLEEAAYISEKNRIPVLISTGAANFSEVANASSIMRRFKADKFVFMYCRSLYPAHIDQMTNMKSIKTLKRMGSAVGFSDHTESDTASILALGLGCTYFEKHFSLSTAEKNPDDVVSVYPDDFKMYMETLKFLHGYVLGTDEIVAHPDEHPEKLNARRSEQDWLRPNYDWTEYVTDAQ